MRHSTHLLPILLLLGSPIAAEESPYSAMTGREIKALSADEISGYLGGGGMGFAMAAELNSYPGPKHVLELAFDLGLSAEQERRTREIFQSMRDRAAHLGQELVEREQALDTGFSEGRIDDDTLHSLLRELGELRGELRYAHLRAHLEMREVLTAAQIQAYDGLRGYGSAGGEHGEGHNGHDHSHGHGG